MMPSVHIDNVGEMAIIECTGRFVRKEAAFKLRDAVTSQTDVRVVVLDLTEMHAIGGGGLGMLMLLQRWAQDHDIRFKLFNPSRPVQDKLKHVDFEIASLRQMMSLLSSVDSQYVRRALIESQFPLHQLSEYD
jgi:anti-anti-sigma regulatory factor